MNFVFADFVALLSMAFNCLPVYVAFTVDALLETFLLAVSAVGIAYSFIGPVEVASAIADGSRGISVVVVGLYLAGRHQWEYGALVSIAVAGMSVAIAYATFLFDGYEEGNPSDELTYAEQCRVIFATAMTASSLVFACGLRISTFTTRLRNDYVPIRQRVLTVLVFATIVGTELLLSLHQPWLGPLAVQLVGHSVFGVAASAAFYVKPRVYSQFLEFAVVPT